MPVFNDKLWDVLSLWNHDANIVVRSLGRIVVLQPLAQPVSLDPDNRILFLIEILPATERLDGDVVFLNLIRLTGEVSFADIYQEPFEAGSPSKDAGSQDRFQFGFLALEIRTIRCWLRECHLAGRYSNNP